MAEVKEVAAEVGIAKASLYKHFPSKEDLAAAAMVRVMRRAQDFLAALPSDVTPLENLRAVVRWTMEVKLAGEMPSLPSQNSTLRATLIANRAQLAQIARYPERLGTLLLPWQAELLRNQLHGQVRAGQRAGEAGGVGEPLPGFDAEEIRTRRGP